MRRLLQCLPGDLSGLSLAEVSIGSLGLYQVRQNFFELDLRRIIDSQLATFFIDFVALGAGVIFGCMFLVGGNDKFHRFAHGFDARGRADARKQLDALLQSPRTQVALLGAILTHLLVLVFDVARSALSGAHLGKLFSDGLPGPAMHTDQALQHLFLFLSPIAMVVTRVELAAAHIVARLD